MTSTPPDLPEQAAAPPKPRWWLVWLFVAAYGAYEFAQSDPTKTTAFRVGVACGTMMMPLLCSLLVYKLWRKPALPPVVAAIFLGLGLVGGGATQAEIAEVRADYLATLDEERAALVERLHLAAGSPPAADAKRWSDAAAAYLQEVTEGARFDDLLEERDVSRLTREAAWGRVRDLSDYGPRLAVAAALAQLAEAAAVRAGLLEAHVGRFTLDGDDAAQFDDDVPGDVVREVRRAEDARRAARRALREHGVGG